MIRLHPEHHDEIVQHARDAYPNECCGYVRMSDDGATSAEVVRATNVSENAILYRLDEAKMLEVAQQELNGRQVVLYHSHPAGLPIPSGIDTQDARQHPDSWVYIIATPRGDMNAWQMHADGVAEVRIYDTRFDNPDADGTYPGRAIPA